MKLASGSSFISFATLSPKSTTGTLPLQGIFSSFFSQLSVRIKMLRRFLYFSSPSSIFLSSDASALIGRLLSIASFTSKALSKASFDTPSYEGFESHSEMLSDDSDCTGVIDSSPAFLAQIIPSDDGATPSFKRKSGMGSS